MSETVTCDLCKRLIGPKEDLVKAEVTTYTAAKQSAGVPDTPWGTSTAAERLDFHAGCWPRAKALLATPAPVPPKQ